MSRLGAGALSQSGPHDEFLELCAASTSGELTDDEQKRLREHLAICASCREALRQYESIVSDVIPAIAASEEPGHVQPAETWSQEQQEHAEKALFDRLAREEKHPPGETGKRNGQSDGNAHGYSRWRFGDRQHQLDGAGASFLAHLQSHQPGAEFLHHLHAYADSSGTGRRRQRDAIEQRSGIDRAGDGERGGRFYHGYVQRHQRHNLQQSDRDGDGHLQQHLSHSQHQPDGAGASVFAQLQSYQPGADLRAPARLR